LLHHGIEFYFTDNLPPGFFLELWRRVSHPFELRFAKKNPYPPSTCFKRAALLGLPTSTFNGERFLMSHSCESPVFSGFVEWQKAVMQDMRPEAYAWQLGRFMQNVHGLKAGRRDEGGQFWGTC
jgi:hypothetical protein